MASVVANRAYMTTATTGTGTITLGSAMAGYQSFDAAGIANGNTVSFTIIDGLAWEVSTGVYIATGTMLTRVLEESSTGSLLVLTGSAQVFITPIGSDLGNWNTAYTTANAALPKAGGTMTGNLTFGDSDKAIFGTSSVLEIYGDGTTSYIKESGTGDLKVRANRFVVQDVTGSKDFLIVSPTAGAVLSHLVSGTMVDRVTTTFGGVALTGDITVTGTVDGRDIATDGTKLDSIGDLSAIATSKAVTAVDVFVYDTSLDSDGGAWRKRTQGTSWYNETLDTATRGSRREFPAVAVIVAETNKVTIYDGDDPSLPMWMVFDKVSIASNVGNIIHAYGTTGDRPLSAVVAKDGYLVPVESGTGGCVYKLSFIADRCEWISENVNYGGFYNGDIGSRNSALGWQYYGTGVGLNIIVDRVVNDVAMTVLPNAPIDAATGLPVPTIAAATDGGVSVIKDDGTVVDLTYTAAVSNEAGGVWFPASGGIAWQSRSAAGGYVYTLVENEIPTADKSTASDALYANFGQVGFAGNDLVTLGLSQPREFVDGVIGSPNGLTHLDENPTTPANGMVAYATSSYNTGWMNGDIKLATLSDTTVGTVTAPSSVVSPTFIASEWDILTASWSIGSGVASCTGTDSVAYLAANNASTGFVSGDTVKITFTVSSYTSGTVSISLSTGVATSGNYTATGTYTYYGKMSGNNSFYFRSDSFVGTISSPVITKLEQPDRSVNDNPLEVFGTITKTVVETGADLVAYSGFSATDYLEQPYNSDLDFGTGDFCVMGWVKLTGAALQFLVYRGTASASSFDIYADGSYNLLFRTPTKTLTVSSFTTVNTWAFCTCVRRNGVGYIYRNGELIGSDADFGDSVTLADAYTRIGYRNDYPATYGNMALWRISATAPTAEQIAKIYNDEKFLFQDNAKATLYGASDAVTALAHDPITGILHAGTSEGRSDFAGLRRVNNTTTAVGVSISAVDGLIVED